MRATHTAASPAVPRSLVSFPALRWAVVLGAAACTSLTTRPTLQPFPLATFDTLTADPAAVIAEASRQVTALGLEVRAVSPAEGYLETRWFDLATHRSHRWNTDPARLVRMRVWADLVAPRQSQVVIETVARRSLDPSVPDREDERVVDAGSPGDSLTQAVRAGLKGRFTDGKAAGG